MALLLSNGNEHTMVEDLPRGRKQGAMQFSLKLDKIELMKANNSSSHDIKA